MCQLKNESRLAERMSRVGPSMTVQISQLARELRSQGRAIINMGAGELDFDTPEYIQQGAIRGICEGQTRYTNVGGTVLLKEAISEKFLRDNDLVYQPGEIIAGTGAKQLIFNALLATLNEGDEVIIPAPYWVSYPDMVRLTGGAPVIVSADAENGYKITPASLKAALTSRTKWLIVNSPANPSGAIYTRDELIALSEVLKAFPQVLILSDDIYEFLTYEIPFISFATAVPDFKNRTLTLNGVSKCYAMTGWRLGYAAGPEWLIEALEKIQGQSTSNPSSVSQIAALTALKGDHTFLNEWRETLQRRRDCAYQILTSSTLLRLQKPQGAFYLFVDCSLVLQKRTRADISLTDDIAVAQFLLEKAGVAVVPGTAFGMAGYIRLAFSLADEDVAEACHLIVRALESLE